MYAYVDADDGHHAACLALLETHPGPLIVPHLVVTEVVYLLATRLGPTAEVRFLGDLASAAFVVEPVHPADWLRIAALVGRYRDLPLGTVDASIVAAAERLGIVELATSDRRHFSVVRPAHAAGFVLLPWDYPAGRETAVPDLSSFHRPHDSSPRIHGASRGRACHAQS